MSTVAITLERITANGSFRQVVGFLEADDCAVAVRKIFPNTPGFLKRLEEMRINVYMDVVPEIDNSLDFLGLLDAKKREFDQKHGR